MMKRNSFTAKGAHFRALKTATFAALASGSLLLLGPAAHAAVLSVGPQPGSPPVAQFGGFVCADVTGGNITSGTKIQAYDCQAAPDQQYEFSGTTIYALGGQRCVDVFGAGKAPGTSVDSATCNGTVAQVWEYVDGQIYNPNSGECLDATNMANGTQLVINPCNGSAGQNWQVK